MLSSMLPLSRTLIGLDLETTGLEPATARIVEFGLVIMRPDQDAQERRTRVNPGVPIPPAATAVHHITDEDVAQAPTFGQLVPNLLKGFAHCDFIGYNVSFDLRVLQQEFKRAGHEWSYEHAHVLDGYRLWQALEGRTLEHAIKRWVPDVTGPNEAHSALWDARMAVLVVAGMLRESPSLPRTVAGLHHLCAPGYFDSEGKLRWLKGDVVFSFGEHRNKPLQHVPKGYFEWVLKKDFSEHVKQVCRDALAGQFPKPNHT